MHYYMVTPIVQIFISATTDKKRYVLGDWRLLDKDTRQPKVSAVIGAVTGDEHSNDSFNINAAEFRLIEFKSAHLMSFFLNASKQ